MIAARMRMMVLVVVSVAMVEPKRQTPIWNHLSKGTVQEQSCSIGCCVLIELLQSKIEACCCCCCCYTVSTS
jgi:hypothetical protein